MADARSAPPSAMDEGRCKPMLPLPHCSGARPRTGCLCVGATGLGPPRSCADRQEGIPLLGVPRFTPRGSLSDVTVTLA